MGIRTTVTLDEDVLRRLKQESRRRCVSLRQVINDVLRSSLPAKQVTRKAAPFRVKAFNMGVNPGMNHDNIHELLDRVEGEDRRF